MPGINKGSDGEITLVVPPSKGSKLSRGPLPDLEGDVPMENAQKDEVDVAEAEKIQAVAGESRLIIIKFALHCCFCSSFSIQI